MLPKLSVCILTYNQEAYIAQAIESALMQEVDFSWEILIGDDCSRDGTWEIVSAYAERFPERIRCLRSPENTGGQELIERLRLSARGDYLAWLEGDDFWTDPRKLRKQVKFLEENPEYVGCTHEIVCVDEHGQNRGELPLSRFCPRRRFTLQDAADGYLPGHGGCSLVYRNVFRELDAESYARFTECGSIGDMKVALFLSLYGPLYRLPEVMGAYRYLPGAGRSFSSRTHGRNMSREYLFWLRERQRMAEALLPQPPSFERAYRDVCYHALVELLKHPGNENREIFREILAETPHKGTALALAAGRALLFPARAIRKRLSRR